MQWRRAGWDFTVDIECRVPIECCDCGIVETRFTDAAGHR